MKKLICGIVVVALATLFIAGRVCQPVKPKVQVVEKAAKKPFSQEHLVVMIAITAWAKSDAERKAAGTISQEELDRGAKSRAAAVKRLEEELLGR